MAWLVAALIATTWASGSDRLIHAAESCTKTGVLIIGAGASAIGAANTLHSQKLEDFLILEAKDYVGGRVRNVHFAGVTLPLGAAWAHNTETNHVIWQLIQHYNLSVYLDERRNVVFREEETGKSIDAQGAKNRLYSALKEVEAMMEKRAKDKLGDLPLDVALHMNGWRATTDLDRVVEVMSFPFENGAHVSKISASSFSAKREQKDYIITDPRGYGFVLQEESRKYYKKILLNKVVESVAWIEEDDVYKVDTSDDSCYKAKYVLVTVSSGVLQADAIAFSPPLPTWKKQALSFLPMGHYCKYFLQLDDSFSTSDYLVNVIAKNTDRYIRIQYLKKSSLFPDKNILSLTSIGDFCKHDTYRKDEDVKSDILALLRKLYGINITHATGFVRSKWAEDPLVRGSYSYSAVGANEEDLRAVQHPVGKIWFAGEYTKVKDPGYVHGAYESGVTQATSILACMADQATCPKDFLRTMPFESYSSTTALLLVTVLIATLIILLVRRK